MPEAKFVDLDEDKIKIIRELEKQLGDNICLVAMEKTGSIYVLEAKRGPNNWERVDNVYPEIKDLRAYYASQEDAHLTKSSLKKLLASKNNLKEKKLPVRMRKII